MGIYIFPTVNEVMLPENMFFGNETLTPKELYMYVYLSTRVCYSNFNLVLTANQICYELPFLHTNKKCRNEVANTLLSLSEKHYLHFSVDHINKSDLIFDIVFLTQYRHSNYISISHPFFLSIDNPYELMTHCYLRHNLTCKEISEILHCSEDKIFKIILALDHKSN